MLRRLALPLAAVVVLLAIAGVSLKLGYLGWVDGGPLKHPDGFDALAGSAGPKRTTIIYDRFEVDGDSVRITRARPLLVSPGLRVLGPRRSRMAAGGTGRQRGWPPVRGDQGPFEGQRVGGEGGLAFGLRARKPGAYYLWRFETRYDQGARHYRRTTTQATCVAIRSLCSFNARLPEPGTPLADIGGASDYGVKLREADAGGTTPVVARYPARPGRRTITVTLTNLTDKTIDVRAIKANPTGVQGFTVTAAATPERFKLKPEAGRTLRLALQLDGCARSAGTVTAVTDALEATVDGKQERVPLLTALEFVEPRTC